MIYVISGICVLAAIGAIVGAFRRYTRTSVWGLSVLLTFVGLAITAAVIDKEYKYYSYVTAGVTVGVFLIATLLFSLIGKILKTAKNSKRDYNALKVKDELDEVNDKLISSVESGDKHEYKRLVKQRKKLDKVSTGVGGVFDVVLGAVSGAVNAAVAACALVLAALMISQFAISVLPETSINDFISDLLEAPVWLDWGKKWVLDILLICVICACFRVGYNVGLSSFLSIVIILGLVALAGYGSFMIASSELCSALVASLSDGLLSGLPASAGDLKPTIAKGIITAVLFVIMFVVIVIVGLFLPRLVDRLHSTGVYMAIDGVLGAVVMLAIVIALLLFAGGITYSLTSFPELDKYFDYSKFADCFYSLNPLGEMIGDFADKFKSGEIFN